MANNNEVANLKAIDVATTTRNKKGKWKNIGENMF